MIGTVTVALSNASGSQSKLSKMADSASPARSVSKADAVFSISHPIQLETGQVIQPGTLFRPLTSQELSEYSPDSALATVTLFQPDSTIPRHTTTPSLENGDLINLHEMEIFHQQMQGSFFQPGSTLFNDNEQQFLSDFLDGFLKEQTINDDYGSSNNLTSTAIFDSEGIRRSFDFSLNHLEPHDFRHQAQVTSKNDTYTSRAINEHGHLNPQNFKRPDSNASNRPVKQPIDQPSIAIKNSILELTQQTLDKSLVPGTVPTPVLAPRKKRHRSSEKLTEEEKRANHIASEQKRRQNIRAGFRALTLLIPSLRTHAINNGDFLEEESANDKNDQILTKSLKSGSSSGPSKFSVLSEAIDFIHYLHARNSRLSSRATELQRRLETS